MPDQGLIPVAVHTLAAATNKVTALAALIKALRASGHASDGSGGAVNQMMSFEIQCAEPWQSMRPAAWSGQRGSFAYQTWLQAVCADPLTQTFIQQASVARLDTSCLARVPLPAFELTPP